MDERLLQAMDAAVDRVLDAHRYDLKGIDTAMKSAAREVIATYRREPRTWDSADISYDTPEPE